MTNPDAKALFKMGNKYLIAFFQKYFAERELHTLLNNRESTKKKLPKIGKIGEIFLPQNRPK